MIVIGKPPLPHHARLGKYRAVPSIDPDTPIHEGVDTPTTGTQTSRREGKPDGDRRGMRRMINCIMESQL